MWESVGTRVMGMGSLISCMTRNIPYRIVLFMWNMIGCFMYAITCAFSVGNSSCRKISLLGIAHPVVGKYILGTGGTSGGEHI